MDERIHDVTTARQLAQAISLRLQAPLEMLGYLHFLIDAAAAESTQVEKYSAMADVQISSLIQIARIAAIFGLLDEIVSLFKGGIEPHRRGSFIISQILKRYVSIALPRVEQEVRLKSTLLPSVK